eukprot:scaffold1117_cov167-Amphora_coffeaeformis.AAC.16
MMNYSFHEELNALPERALSSSQQIVDWTIAWRGRQQVFGDDRTLSPFPRQVRNVLQEYDIYSLKIQVFNTPTSSLDATFIALDSMKDDDGSGHTTTTYASAAGLSITATFSLPTTFLASSQREQAEKFLEKRFRNIILTVLSERWVLGSLESIKRQRLHRFVQVDWQSVQKDVDSRNHNETSRVPITLILPHEAFSLSAEGVRAFVETFSPCGQSGILGLQSYTKWSNLLLGHEEAPSAQDRSITSWGRRGLWIEARRGDNTADDYQIDAGLLWRIRTKGRTTSWSTLLGDGILGKLENCHLADTTALRLLSNARLTVEDTCENFATNAAWNLQKPCLQKRQNAKTNEPPNDFYEVQVSLWRTQGPGHGGRMETVVVNRHVACEAKIKIWHVIPSVLKPVWSSFETSSNSLPQRRWKDDGALELTMETHMKPDSVLQYSFDYEPLFLSIETFPADPNRGFELPPVRVIVEPLCDVREYLIPPQIHLFSESLLFLSPLPDASMPFNVLSLSCTLFAFVVGSILNLLVRRASEKIKYKLHPELKPKSKMRKIKESFGTKFKALREKVLGNKEVVHAVEEKAKTE